MPWLLLSAVGFGSAYIGSLVNNFSEKDSYTHPASVGSSQLDVTKIMLYVAGGIGIVLLAKKAGLYK